MLITVSGMVGSGKSTTAARVGELLTAAGLQPRRLRFRYLRLLGFASSPRRQTRHRQPDVQRPTERSRASGFALRPLTAATAAGYAVRILAFRLSRVGSQSRCDILDRYFYDNLVHYELRSWRERLYAHVLRALIPTPDLSILVVASNDTISSRRREYALEYVTIVSRRYEQLPTLFPLLLRIDTDPGNSADETIRRAVEGLVGRSEY